MKKTFENILLLIIPLYIIIQGLFFTDIQTPYYMLNWDPEYAYLYNGAAILSGKAPTHIDHPGSTLQILIAALIFFNNIGNSNFEIYSDIFLNSEHYLFQINSILLFYISLSNFVLAHVIYKKYKSIFLTTSTQLGILIFPISLISLGRIMPDTLLIGLTLNILTLHILYNNKQQYLKRICVIFGIGLATKITFFPIMGLFLPVLKTLNDYKKFIVITISSFIFFTLIWLFDWKNYYYFIRWVYNLILGSGIYGDGPKTIINFNNYLNNFYNLLIFEWQYCVLISFTLILSIIYIHKFNYIYNKHEKTVEQETHNLICGLFFVQFLSLVIVAKHPASIRYLLPAITILTFNFSILLISIFNKVNNFIFNIFKIAMIFIFILAITFSIKNSYSLLLTRKTNQELNNTKIINSEINNYNKCLVVHRDSSTYEFAHYFGLTWGKPLTSVQNYIDNTDKFKHILFYDPNQQKYYSIVGKNIKIDQIKNEYSCILFFDVNDIKIINY